MRELPLAWRRLRQSPEFTVLTALTLAWSIGVNLAVFGVLHRALWSALPYRDPERLVDLSECDSTRNRMSVS